MEVATYICIGSQTAGHTDNKFFLNLQIQD